MNVRRANTENPEIREDIFTIPVPADQIRKSGPDSPFSQVWAVMGRSSAPERSCQVMPQEQKASEKKFLNWVYDESRGWNIGGVPVF